MLKVELMKITPYILGSGRAAQALLKSLSILELSEKEFEFAKPIQLERNQSLKNLDIREEFPILLIATPHALHASQILEANGKFKLIVSEKPLCTSLKEIDMLKKVSTPVALCHGYRQSWGVQTLKKLIQADELGEIISIEGRYWQSSTAQRFLIKNSAQSWKNNPELSGPFDALLDIGTHWADAANFLMPTKLESIQTWLSYVNSEAPHRDSHIHLYMNFEKDKKAMASISKNIHGASNHFEINVIGSKKFATWKFLEPDTLELSEGSKKAFITREESHWGSTQSAHHALGWLEGYVEILKQSLRNVTKKSFVAYPNLEDGLWIMEKLLKTEKLL
jgi:predicted dehydrogenase